MTNLSKEIYRKIDYLIPDLQNIELFTRKNLADKGLQDIHVVVFESTPEIITFVLTRHILEHGKTVANPCFEIAVNPKEKTAKVVTYKDENYFHTTQLIPDDVGMMSQSEANRFLYEWLQRLKITEVVRQH